MTKHFPVWTTWKNRKCSTYITQSANMNDTLKDTHFSARTRGTNWLLTVRGWRECMIFFTTQSDRHGDGTLTNTSNCIFKEKTTTCSEGNNATCFSQHTNGRMLQWIILISAFYYLLHSHFRMRFPFQYFSVYCFVSLLFFLSLSWYSMLKHLLRPFNIASLSPLLLLDYFCSTFPYHFYT